MLSSLPLSFHAGGGDVSVCSQGSKVFKSYHKKSSPFMHRLAAAALGLPRVDRLTCVGGQILISEHAGLFWCARGDEGKGAAVGGKQRRKRKKTVFARGERGGQQEKHESTKEPRTKSRQIPQHTRTQMPVVAFSFSFPKTVHGTFCAGSSMPASRISIAVHSHVS